MLLTLMFDAKLEYTKNFHEGHLWAKADTGKAKSGNRIKNFRMKSPFI